MAPLDVAILEARRDGAAADAAEAAAAEVAVRMAAGGTLSRVVKDVAAEFGVPRSKVYEEALRQRGGKR